MCLFYYNNFLLTVERLLKFVKFTNQIFFQFSDYWKGNNLSQLYLLLTRKKEATECLIPVSAMKSGVIESKATYL